MTREVEFTNSRVEFLHETLIQQLQTSAFTRQSIRKLIAFSEFSAETDEVTIARIQFSFIDTQAYAIMWNERLTCRAADLTPWTR
jgi:hypothetical protein